MEDRKSEEAFGEQKKWNLAKHNAVKRAFSCWKKIDIVHCFLAVDPMAGIDSGSHPTVVGSENQKVESLEWRPSIKVDLTVGVDFVSWSYGCSSFETQNFGEPKYRNTKPPERKPFEIHFGTEKTVWKEAYPTVVFHLGNKCFRKNLNKMLYRLTCIPTWSNGVDSSKILIQWLSFIWDNFL